MRVPLGYGRYPERLVPRPSTTGLSPGKPPGRRLEGQGGPRVSSLWRAHGGLLLGVGLLLPSQPSRAAVPVPTATWRGCAGVEEGIVLSVPAPLRNASVTAGQPLGAGLSLMPRVVGFTATASLIAGEQGKPALLVRLKPPAGARAGQYRMTLTVRRGAAVVA